MKLIENNDVHIKLNGEQYSILLQLVNLGLKNMKSYAHVSNRPTNFSNLYDHKDECKKLY